MPASPRDRNLLAGFGTTLWEFDREASLEEKEIRLTTDPSRGPQGQTPVDEVEHRPDGPLWAVVKRLWPQLATMNDEDRIAGVADVLGVLYAAPAVVVGLLWLAAITDLALLPREWPTLALLFVILFVLHRLDFFVLVEVAPGYYSDWAASLVDVVIWSAVLLFGPSALWLAFFFISFCYALDLRRSAWTRSVWNVLRNYAISTAGVLLGGLTAAALYERWSGLFPLPGLALPAIVPAFGATIVWSLVPALVWLPLLIYFVGPRKGHQGSRGTMVRFWLAALGLPFVVDPFAILAAGLHTQNGLGAYLFFVAGLLVAALLAHRLSQAVQRSQQRSRELQKLETLGRAILSAPPDASGLPDVLREHVTGMIPRGQLEICVFPDQVLLRDPEDGPPVAASAWDWLRGSPEGSHFMPGQDLPWDSEPASDPVAVVPIFDVQSGEALGGIYLSLPWRLPWQAETAVSLLPALQSLAAQVASALHGARTYTQTLAHERVQQELALAWQIQSSFLPHEVPSVPGWQLAATLRPASETSGDFYDFIALSNGHLGVLIADVADKGVGAALYMALSRTLIRTYSAEYPKNPELAIAAANRRILMDSETSMFVTVFYGVLDPATGLLTYCNAGHSPPYVLQTQEGDLVQSLGRTGMALGVTEDVTWKRQGVSLTPGGVLVLYTDGITDASDEHGAFFGRERLAETARASKSGSAQAMQEAIIEEIQGFVGDAPQFDDMTLMVVIRDPLDEHSSS
jgi:serine phosphatase RsbU (regulator of sigma subunit)